MRMELALRFDYGSIVPWVRRIDGALVGIAGPDAVSLRTPVDLEGRDLRTYAEFTVEKGDRVPFVLTWFPSNRTLPDAIDAEQALDRDARLLGRLDAPVHDGGALVGCGPALAHHAEGADVRADGRHRRSAHDVAAGSDRGRSQLGLPLLLAA